MAGYNHDDMGLPKIYFLYEEFHGNWHCKASWTEKEPSRFGGYMNPVNLIREAESYKETHNNGRKVKIEIIL